MEPLPGFFDMLQYFETKQYKGINNDLKHLQRRGKVKMVEDKNNLQAIKKGSDQNATMRG